MQTYTIGPVQLFLERSNNFTPVSIKFDFSVGFDSIVPDTMEEASAYHDAVARVIKFIQGINASYVLETNFQRTAMFLDGSIENVSIEVPDGCNKIPLLGMIFFSKVNALLGSFELLELKLSFAILDSASGNVHTTLTYNTETMGSSKILGLFKEYESEWVEELEEESADSIDEMEDDAVELLTQPWWKRCDGQVRDFINVPEGSIAFEDIKVLSVDIGDELLDVEIKFSSDEDVDDPEHDTDDDDDDDHTPTEPTSGGDDYLKF